MLAAIDFAIIPRSSVEPRTLKIIDMKETSGPYFVDSDDGTGKIKLRLNPNHYHYSSDIPDEVTLVPMTAPQKGESPYNAQNSHDRFNFYGERLKKFFERTAATYRRARPRSVSLNL